MIDFSALQGLTIPEGKVTKIEAGGIVLWKLQSDDPSTNKIILEIKTANINSSGHTGILLDVYLKSGGTATITYGDITETITDDGTVENPNAQLVSFSSVQNIPSSGTLTIEGDCVAFGIGTYTAAKGGSFDYCSCVAGITDFGNIKYIPDYAFFDCNEIVIPDIPEGVESIGYCSFDKYFDDSMVYTDTLVLPSTLKSIGSNAFVYYNNSAGIDRGSHVLNIIIKATTPPTLGADCFGVLEYAPNIYVPIGCGEIYKAADGWSVYASKIMEVAE